MALRVRSLFARGSTLAAAAESLRTQAVAFQPSALLWLTDGVNAQCLANAMASCATASIGAVSQAGLIGGGGEHNARRDEVTAVALAIALPADEPAAVALPWHSAPDSLPSLPSEAWAEFAAATPEDSPHLMLLAAPPRAGAFPLERWLGMLDVALPWAKKVGGVTAGGGSELFVGDRCYDGGAVGLALQGIDMEARSFQGAVPFGPSYEITACEGNIVHALDGRPVGEVLTDSIERFAVQPGQSTANLMCGLSVPGRAAATRGAAAAAANESCAHEYVIRALLAFSKPHSVLAVGASPDLVSAPGCRLQLFAFSADAALAEMRAGARRMSSEGLCGGLVVSCAGRGVGLYGEWGVETAELHAALGPDLAVSGLFAGGEIGPVGQRTFVHTYTTTVGLLRPRCRA